MTMNTFTRILFSLSLSVLLGSCYFEDNSPKYSGCGDQLAYSERDGYADFAEILNDDVLVLDMSKTNSSCSYLGIEAGTSGSCGGRQLDDDVIDITYSVLANGETTGLQDGIDFNDRNFSTVFPFLAGPHN